MYRQLSKTNLKGLRSGYCTGAGTLVFYDSGYRLCYMCDTHGGDTQNSIFKLYIRNFINISSFHNLLDVIYTEISGTMKHNPSVSDSGLVVNAFGY